VSSSFRVPSCAYRTSKLNTTTEVYSTIDRRDLCTKGTTTLSREVRDMLYNFLTGTS
jgi:hypothetical protein